jgi:hypothetical protein
MSEKSDLDLQSSLEMDATKRRPYYATPKGSTKKFHVVIRMRRT